MINEQESKQILEQAWKEGKEDFVPLFENAEQVRNWVVKNGKRVNLYGNFKSVYEEGDENSFRIEAVNYEKYPDTFDVLNGELLTFNVVLDNYAIEFRFFKNIEREAVIDASVEDIEAVGTEDELEIETRIDYFEQNEEESTVHFPRRPAHILSGNEIKVASFFLQKFVDTKINPQN